MLLSDAGVWRSAPGVAGDSEPTGTQLYAQGELLVPGEVRSVWGEGAGQLLHRLVQLERAQQVPVACNGAEGPAGLLLGFLNPLRPSLHIKERLNKMPAVLAHQLRKGPIFLPFPLSKHPTSALKIFLPSFNVQNPD